ncbi:hypothetical protein M378DRAFT_167507 [Amanita muscaria Koide BX008]|uniref:Uncharacterized protein n=1 Tax=Amanita muscaria (strain Koide BX008) TaxID=946122 RepID=A0A0C2WHS3_AMAMK|nr:hypothetical protein M378DRAFT_167507 [Amanita muscaria Koide BX008]
MAIRRVTITLIFNLDLASFTGEWSAENRCQKIGHVGWNKWEYTQQLDRSLTGAGSTTVKQSFTTH